MYHEKVIASLPGLFKTRKWERAQLELHQRLIKKIERSRGTSGNSNGSSEEICIPTGDDVRE